MELIKCISLGCVVLKMLCECGYVSTQRVLFQRGNVRTQKPPWYNFLLNINLKKTSENVYLPYTYAQYYLTPNTMRKILFWARCYLWRIVDDKAPFFAYHQRKYILFISWWFTVCSICTRTYATIYPLHLLLYIFSKHSQPTREISFTVQCIHCIWNIRVDIYLRLLII